MMVGGGTGQDRREGGYLRARLSFCFVRERWEREECLYIVFSTAPAFTLLVLSHQAP
jgi:hypothetical protein